MAYSRVTLVKRVRSVLGDNAWYDTCTEAMDATEVGLDVGDGTKYSTGMVVEFTDDGELCLVLSVSSNTLTVIRNYNFSVTATAGTGTTHSSGCVIVSDPAFRYSDIIEAISSILTGLWPNVYRKVVYTLTPQTDGNLWYELDDGPATDVCTALDLSSVEQLIPGGGSSTNFFFYGARGSSYPVGFRTNLPTAKIGSTVGLYIPYLRNTTASIVVNAIAPIDDTYAAPNYSYLSAGVEVDAVIYLTVARLILEHDIKRTVYDDVSQGEIGVFAGSRTRLAEYYEQKGHEYQRKWEAQLRASLPRMPQGRNRV